MADHPVRVPPELFTEWLNEAMEKTSLNAKPGTVAAMMADRAAQWGADQQLEKVNNWIRCSGSYPKTDIRWELEIVQLDRLGRELWQAMRPKPPTLAEQGLKALGRSVGLKHFRTLSAAEQDDIRAALNRLAELEAQQ